MVKDIRAKILSNEKIGPMYFRMRVLFPGISKSASPGQFVEVRCSEDTDPLLRRPLGVHRTKGKDEFEMLYEVVGKGTGLLSEKETGEKIDILGPLGNGYSLPTSEKGSLAILVAGGIGVAPLFSLAEKLCQKKIKTIVLIGARTKDLILCEKDFKEIGAIVYTTTDDGTCGCKGLVSKLFEDTLAKNKAKNINVYACGPHVMLKCIALMCKDRKLDCQVSMEEKMACGIGACLGCSVKVDSGNGAINKLACKDGPIFNASEVIW